MRYLIQIVFLVAAIFSLGCQKDSSADNQICFNKNCFHVEIVSKGEDLQRGLQFRKSLDPSAGMLFVFPTEKKQAFWMKDTWIPLDMIWLDYSHNVVHLEENVPPCVSDPCPIYSTSQNALYVLEINAGKSREIGLQVGDTLKFKLRELEKAVEKLN